MSTSPRPSVLLIRGTSDTFLGKSSPASRRIGGMAMDLVKAFCNWAVCPPETFQQTMYVCPCRILSYVKMLVSQASKSVRCRTDMKPSTNSRHLWIRHVACVVWMTSAVRGPFRKIIARGMVSIMAISQAKPGGCYLLPKKQPHHGSCRSTAIGLLAQWASWHCPSWVSILCCLAWKGLSRLCTKVA